MTLRSWRIYKAKHERSAFTGEGARLFGGRWNSRSTAVVYTAGSESLAVLEMLVHLSAREAVGGYRVCKVSFDESLVEGLDPAALPLDWRSDPVAEAVRRLGDRWVGAGSSAILRVSSVLVESESNFLINPAHPDFPRVQVARPRPLRFDPRLVGRERRQR